MSMNAPLVSVKMLTYNHRPHLAKAIDCVLAQERDFGLELLIGEDCSTDGGRELAFEYQRRHPDVVRVVTSDTNVGIKANSKRTEEAARGKYLAYCEGDDFWHDPTKLARQVRFLEENPGHVMVHSNCHEYYVEHDRLHRDAHRSDADVADDRAYFEILEGRRRVMTLTVLVRRDVIQSVIAANPETTDPKWPMGDTQRWLELARVGKVKCFHESMATLSTLLESATRSRDKRKELAFVLKGRELMLHYLKKYPIPDDMDRRVRARLALSALRRAFVVGDHEVAEAMYREYQSQNGQTAWRARLWRFGAGSEARRKWVGPLIRTDHWVRKAGHRAWRILGRE